VATYSAKRQWSVREWSICSVVVADKDLALMSVLPGRFSSSRHTAVELLIHSPLLRLLKDLKAANTVVDVDDLNNSNQEWNGSSGLSFT
jgi:hypothetical protein